MNEGMSRMTAPSPARAGIAAIGRLVAVGLTLVVVGAALAAVPASAGTAPAAAGPVERTSRNVYFTSPSGNIGCLLTRRAARCDIAEYNYSPPPKPASCDFDWGQSLQVRKRAHFVCVSDTVAVGDRVLRYGDSLRRGNKKCTSRRSGMVCRNLHTGHGFRLSRDDVDRF